MNRRILALGVLLVVALGVLGWQVFLDPDDGGACTTDELFTLPPLDEVSVGLDLSGTLIAEVERATDVIDGPDDAGELWVSAHAGLLIAVAPDGGTTTILDITDEVLASGEQGFLAVELSPDEEELFISYTDTVPASVVERMPIVNGRPDQTARTEVLRLEQPHRWHNGGQITFGPDGYLYFAMGDGGDEFGDPDLGIRSMDPATWFGTIMRLDVSDRDEPGYQVPDDNPYVNGEGAPEVLAHGLRNPWRFDIDEVAGEIWIADVGHGCWEEINVVPLDELAGTDFGWPLLEGNRAARGREPVGQPPLHVYGRDDGRIAVTGGFVYRGSAFPELEGAYLYSDLGDGNIRALWREDGRVKTADLGVEVPAPVSFHHSRSGDILVVSHTDGVYRLTPG